MTDSFNVFVIGPMGADKDKPSESGTPISQHMVNIAAALRSVMPNYRSPPSRFEVFSPHDLAGGDITDDVFSKIDDADLGIADITSRSPSVMYELAYFHAIGTPVIVIDDGSVNDQNRPFYLKDVNILTVKDFDVATLSTALNERLQRFFNPNDIQNFGNNPISRFYGAPLIEISGAATIARGYYKNFVKLIVNEGSGIKMLNDGLKFEKLYIVRPSPDLAAGRDFDAYEAAFGGADEKSFSVWGGERPRKLSAHYDGRAFFDIPRTVYTLANSPRLQRLENALDGMDNVSPERKEEMLSRALKGLIDAFFFALRRSIANDDNAFRGLVEFVEVGELSEIVQTP